MPINLRSHFLEGSYFMPKNFQQQTLENNFVPSFRLSDTQIKEQKIELWNRFVDSGLIGITEEDCGVLPRLLPYSYFKEIEKTAYNITNFVLKLLSLPANEVKAIIPNGPIRDFLIDELQVLKYRKNRITGSFRFDMAIVGEPIKGNSPKLLEINEIGFGGLTRVTFIQQTMLSLLPELAKNKYVLDATRAEIKNFLRLGKKFARFQYDAYDWEEQVLLKESSLKGIDLKLISPQVLGFEFSSHDYPLLQRLPIKFKKNKIIIGKKEEFKPDFLQMGYSFELNDYLRAPQMYQNIVRSETPQYSPFLTGLVASKSILVLLSDKNLRKKLLGNDSNLNSAILHSDLLSNIKNNVKTDHRNFVLKHVDGLGGEKVYFDDRLLNQLKNIKKNEESHYVAQERTKLNVLNVEGTLSKKHKVISDLGVFVQYDWSNGKFNHFEVGGFITRATNKSYKVNVSEGGMQIPVFF